MNRLIRLTGAVLLSTLLNACSDGAGVAPADAALPTDTATAAPTALPTDTATAAPTALPTDTATAAPTALPTAAPTNTPTASIQLGDFRYVYPVRSTECQASSSHHDYPASDIFCPIGTEYVAVTDGVIDYLSREDRYAMGERDPAVRGGLSVAFIGDDGVRYYGSHLSAVADDLAVGTRVSAGQLLGLTGDSGNAAGTPPHVHFGISPPTTAEDWQVRRGTIWPQPYLRAWANGEALTPQLQP
jgi:peptidoglycan LD-endopeptidase LytH